jgi:hypothetical protein
MDRAGDEGLVARSWEYFEAEGIVLEAASPSQSALEVAGCTGAGVEHRAKPIPVCKRVVRRPFVLEQLLSSGNVSGTGRWPPDYGQAIRE